MQHFEMSISNLKKNPFFNFKALNEKFEIQVSNL